NLTAPCAQVPTHQGRLPLVTERFVSTAHRRGVQVHVWTIDDRAEMTRLLDLGVDGIMTDRPQVLKELLMERGQWHE
ncbi:MAG: glycerophosphodiester phosphodiesterase family protein, partial [Acidimicrobiales bacterium]